MNPAQEAIAYGLAHRVVWEARVEAWRVGTLPAPSGWAVWVRPLMFTSAIIVGPPDDDWYADRWCYQTSAAAIAAAQEWLATDPVPAEPTGWHCHPVSGRRRPNGNPAAEYVEH